VRGAGRFWPESRGVLEDALRARVVDELFTADETLLHRQPAPGAEAIGEVGGGWSRVRFRRGDIGHVRHFLRPLRTLSIDRVTPDRVGAKKKFLYPLSCEKFRGIVRMNGSSSQFFHPLNRKVYNLYE